MRRIIQLLLFVIALGWAADTVEAQRRGGGSRGGGSRGGGGRNFSRSSARPSVNARPSQRPSRGSGSFNRPAQRPAGGYNRGDVNRGDFNRYDRTTNIDRDVNVRDVDIDGGYGYGRYGYGNGCCHYHPVARAAVATTAAYATAAAIGSSVYALPSECTVMVVNGISYQQCGSTWYQPQFSGTTTEYIVVSPPS